MKKLLILGSLVSVLSLSSTAFAMDFKPYVNSFTGYQLDPSNTKKHQEQDSGFSQDDHGLVGVALGTTVKNGYSVQVEYSQVKASGNGSSSKTTQDSYSVVGLKDFETKHNFTPYVLSGIGYTEIEGKNSNSTEQPFISVGGGVKYAFNGTLSAITELRGNYLTEGNYWQPQALVGVKINLGAF